MLITNPKPLEALEKVLPAKCFLLCCTGCREITLAPDAFTKLQADLAAEGKILGSRSVEYLCNPDNLPPNLALCTAALAEADAVLVFACGVGTQTVAAYFDGQKPVFSGCDSIRLPGAQGFTPTEADCAECGQCFLNGTGGICPLTACTKGLLNGPCGGAKAGMCEADDGMECGWERICQTLSAQGRLHELRTPVLFRDYRLSDTPDQRNGAELT